MTTHPLASTYRTHLCNALGLEHNGLTVKLSGWLNAIRDHGDLLFLDLRDHYGLVQCVVEVGTDAHRTCETLPLESVITIEGEVRTRSDETKNPSLTTGDIEVYATRITVLSQAAQLPFPVNRETNHPEDIRFRHRFLDLRRQTLHDRMVLRSEIIHFLRQRMREDSFLEIQTPLLTAPSPEGARDFLVASRLHPATFYALPQAPQMFKQILMTSGFDRYFQIAPCFRDEDARADRSPGEFYQLDLEMAFVEQEDVLRTVEAIMADLYTAFSRGKRVTQAPFTRLTYHEAISRYGTDKPDLRNALHITDVSSTLEGTTLRIFAQTLEAGGTIRAIRAPGAAHKPRSWFDQLNAWARKEGQGGLGYITWKEQAEGPLAKHLSPEHLTALRNAAHIETGDALFFIAGRDVQNVLSFAAQTRDRLGRDCNCFDEDQFAFCWIVDYPMFEHDANGRIQFSHNPFSMPQGGLESLQNKDPLSILAWQYDIVCNGVELSSGAIRNHEPASLLEAFEIAGYEKEQVEKQFAGLLRALRFGAPPHGGSAPGVDRIVMMLAGCESLRDITPFPFNQSAQDLMMGAPVPIEAERYKELHLAPLPTQT